MNKKGEFTNTLVVMGGILIFVGIAWVLATNWHSIPSLIKILVLVLATATTFFAGTKLRINDFYKLGSSLIFLGSLLYTLSVFLIAQIFSTSASLQGTAFLLLLSWIGVALFAYTFDSSSSLIISLIELFFWAGLQYAAFAEHSSFSLGVLAVMFLSLGALLYGLSLLHRAKKHNFSYEYVLFAAGFVLLFSFILSFQISISSLWSLGLNLSNPATLFVGIVAIISVGLVVFGIKAAFSSASVPKKEIYGFIFLIMILVCTVLFSFFATKNYGTCEIKSCYDLKNKESCEQTNIQNQVCKWSEDSWGGRPYCNNVPCYDFKDKTSCENSKINCIWKNDSYTNFCQQSFGKNDYPAFLEKTCSEFDGKRVLCESQESCKWMTENYFFGGNKIPMGVYSFWIIANIVFILVIIAIILYGTEFKSKNLVNVGMIFFALEILSRYIGFLMDLWGQMSMALVFISGGIVLILGGVLIEKWRRKLLRETGKNTKD